MRTPLFRRWLIFLSAIVLSAPVARAQVPGPGNALNLDGLTGYAQAPNGVWFSNDFTIEGWVYARSYNSWSRLIDFANGPNDDNVFFALSDGTEGFPTLSVLTDDQNGGVFAAPTKLPLNQWVHLAATLKGNTGTIYMNGLPVGNGTLNVPPVNVVRTKNYIGRSNYADQYANAIFDEIRIWNVARTQGQIQAYLHRSLVGNEPGLMGYWRMDEGLGTTLNDSSGNGQTANVLGGTSWTNSTVPLVAGAGSALNFNAATGQFASIPHQSSLNPFPITVMTWFKAPTNTSGGGAFVNKYVSASLNGYQIFLTGTQMKAWYSRDSINNVLQNGVMTAGPVNDDLWHHAAMVVDTNGGRLYLDGVLQSSQPWKGTPGPPTTTTALVLGLYPGDSFLNGQVDEVSVWSTAFSTAQIQSAMNHPLAGTESGLAGYWRLDEGAGTNILDVANGHNGTLIGGATWTNSQARLVVPDPGYAADLNGNGAYVQVPNGVWFSNDFTIEGWVYARSYNNWSRFFDFADGPNTNNVYLALSAGTTGLPTMGVFTNNNGTPTLQAPTQLPLNQWVHLAATLQGNTGTIYINGNSVASGTLNTPPNVIRTNNYIGRSNYGGDAYANALFDEIRIWNVARTGGQIQQDMNVSLKGSETNLIGYWRFDEGTGTNTVDATANGNDAALTGGVLWRLSGAPVLNPSLRRATTLPATTVTGSSATLNGTVNPGELFTDTAWFQYGPTTNYGSTTASTIISNTNTSVVPVTALLNDLVGGTLYHFRLVASNQTSSAAGADLTFTTPLYALSASNLVEGPGGGNDGVFLTQVGAGQSWTATASDPWLHLSPPNQSGTGNATVAFSQDANPGATRTGTLNIGGKLLTVTQAGSTYVAAQTPITLVTSASGLNMPRAVAADVSGNLFIADSFQETIDKWQVSAGTTFVLVSLQPTIGFPYGVAVDSAGGVFFSDNRNNKLQRWTSTNGVVTLANVTQPVGVAVDGAGNAYFGATSGGLPAIYKWTAASNTVTTLITTGLNGTFGVAVDAFGNVYSTDDANNRVYKWDAATSNLTTLLDFNSGLNFPRGVAVDGAGNVYIANWGNNTVQKWSAIDGSMTTLVNSGLNRPFGVAVDLAGTVYIADSGNSLIKALPHAFVDVSPRYENPSAGSDTLPIVLPSTVNLHVQFTPGSDQPWLTILGSTNGAVTFSFTANTNSARAANINVLGQSIPVVQSGLIGTPPAIMGAQKLTNGAFQFAFTNTQGSSFTVLTATNVTLPLSNWTVMGPPSNIAPGLFQFTSPPTNNDPQRFYRVRSP